MSKKTATFHVSPSGKLTGLHYDDLDMGFLGKKQIGRASEILFDEEHQSFYIQLPQMVGGHSLPSFLRGFRGYDEARQFEVMVLETAAISQVKIGYEGAFYRMANECRSRFDGGDSQVERWNGNSDLGSCPV